MKKLNKSGFSVVELFLILLVIILLCVVGWMVYKDHHKTLTSSGVSTNKTTTKSTSAINPYKGWLSYCSSGGGLCFKYQNSWTLSSSGNSIVPQESVINSSKSVFISYYSAGVISGTGSPATVNVISVNPTQTKDFEVVGLIQTISSSTNSLSNYYDYLFISSSAATEGASNNPYTTNSTYTNSYEPGQYLFTNKNLPKYSQAIEVSDSNSTLNASFNSLQAAENWFKGADVVTATQILESLNYN